MSLLNQFRVLLAFVLLLTWSGSLGVSILAARNTLQTQVQIKNEHQAELLSLVLARLDGQAQRIKEVIDLQFDTGLYQQVRWVGADGQVRYERTGPTLEQGVPDWFIAILPVTAEAGQKSIDRARSAIDPAWAGRHDASELGRVEVLAQSAYAHADLWRASLETAVGTAIIALLAFLVAEWMARRFREGLKQVLAQAQALVDGRFVKSPPSIMPELRPLTRAMNEMVDRVQAVWDAQNRQVEALRSQAQLDDLTGFPLRRHFLALLHDRLQTESGDAQGSLYLLRLADLADINHRLGHSATDDVLRTYSSTIARYCERMPGALLGRLNGSDVAVFLPGDAGGQSIAESLSTVISSALASIDRSYSVAIGGTHAEHGDSVGEVMAAADFALAMAEGLGHCGVAWQAMNPGGPVWGEQDWREHLTDALINRRVQVLEFPVLDPFGEVLHHECPMRVMVGQDGDHEPAAQWLPWARRCQMLGQFDDLALSQVISAIEADGKPRCVNLSCETLAAQGFADALRVRLSGTMDVSQKLWIDINEADVIAHWSGVIQSVRMLRKLGVHIGIEHAGIHESQWSRYADGGLEYVKLDRALSVNMRAGDAQYHFVQSVVALCHTMGLLVVAEGVDAQSQSEALWSAGLDGQTGSLIKHQA